MQLGKMDDEIVELTNGLAAHGAGPGRHVQVVLLHDVLLVVHPSQVPEKDAGPHRLNQAHGALHQIRRLGGRLETRKK